ncbi:hypothetical protein ACFXKY_08035 [Streptomyces canus]|uniref:hypothetical protein n=1 Tax=Streptomyces canus TaxID=58343 RepID=UPI00369B19F7
MLDAVSEPDCTQAVADRVEELLWVLDHLDDLDADFLAIYRIDLEQDEISARRYFALAHRLPAYQGVMSARQEEAREQTSSTTPTRTSSTPAAAQRDDVTEVSLTQFRAQFPWMVSMGQGG